LDGLAADDCDGTTSHAEIGVALAATAVIESAISTDEFSASTSSPSAEEALPIAGSLSPTEQGSADGGPASRTYVQAEDAQSDVSAFSFSLFQPLAARRKKSSTYDLAAPLVASGQAPQLATAGPIAGARSSGKVKTKAKRSVDLDAEQEDSWSTVNVDETSSPLVAVKFDPAKFNLSF